MCQLSRWTIVIMAATLTAAMFGCADQESSLVVVVEGSLHAPLRPSLEQYAQTMEEAQYEIHVVPWAAGGVEELRSLLFEYVDDFGVEGALLIGDLPAAWYEQMGFEGVEEEFPTDFYLQDRDARWIDQDGDGVPDFHTELHSDIYTARLVGTVEQLQDYFAKLEYYRRVGPLVEPSAYIFLDDPWAHKDTSDLFGLDELYGDVEVAKDVAHTSMNDYLARLNNGGAEFVYQWIHAYHYWLGFDHTDPDSGYEQQKLYSNTFGHLNIEFLNLKASFVHMANCYGARFTGEEETSLAETFTVGTDYGLVALGSTKPGGQTNPRLFHRHLIEGMRWGEAYRHWFNETGKYNDLWHLGVVLIGDPLLRVTGDLFPAGPSEEVSWSYSRAAERSDPCCDPRIEVDGFEDYREAHPEFFE